MAKGITLVFKFLNENLCSAVLLQAVGAVLHEDLVQLDC